MTWLSVVLVGLGVGDIVRSTSWRPGRVVGHVVAPVVILALALLAGLSSWADLLALVLAAAAGAAWAELSRRTQMTGRAALAALAVFAGTVVGLLAFSGAASHPGGVLATWLAWADLPGHGPLPVGRVLLFTGLALFNVATANIIVRLVLLTIGALRPSDVTDANAAAAAAAALAGSATPPAQGQPADRLKGGRLLGPMERLVILGLGVAGEFGAAGLVIAAKGLLRFPEIQAAARGNGAAATGSGPHGSYPGGPAGIDDVTEYFLVGSFVSWLIALGSLALTV
ncbi:hypothetical protein GCM10009868_18360 [Terrabacter aerolatus]|uniref:Uncharacterized protein n=1 Tax=Terrabacter aerolatus TaxID=422442 RepID=A0A512CZR7_9MICO|nr:hypothetical protein [Terrabacter aerolatus]GEO29707.1 hypothetical protein TAE01_15170 [Terrabacter aerolatus]